MGQYTSYWLYQKYEQMGNQEPIPVYPNIYSINGDGTMPLVVRNEDDTECGYVPPVEPTYRWINIPINQDYICDDCYTSITRWQKTDKTICVEYEVVPQYRWVNMDASVDYYCEDVTKYYKQKRQVSYNEGRTWEDVTPAEYQRGGVAEALSTDCGYVPPPPEPEYDKQPFTVIPREDDSGVFIYSATSEYYTSIDSGNTWVKGGARHVAAGTKVMLKGNLTPKSGTGSHGIGALGVIKYSGENQSGRAYFDVEGNITSLTNWQLKPHSFRLFFVDTNNSQKIVSAKNLYLPSAFADYCYNSMFSYCEYLTEAPVIRGSIAYYACYNMFQYCASLTSVKIIGGTIKKYAANRMFWGCNSLNYVECIIDRYGLEVSATTDWLANVSSTGTFVTPSYIGWSSGASGIPSRWTRVDSE